MRKFIATTALGLTLISSPVAWAIPDWLLPSPVTIAVQVGKWILFKDTNEEVFHVRVQATGNTESEARTEAFRLAVDQAVGSLLVSETEIQNGTIARNDVINYSSGYVHDFEYVNIYKESNKVTLQIDVYVSKSKIADRITVQNSTQGNLEGGRIAEAFKSIQTEKQTGDKLLQTVLNDFPQKALDVDVTNIEYSNYNRTPAITISFKVQWKPKYITALKEVMHNTMIPVQHKRLSQNGVVFFDNKGCYWDCYTAYTTDKNRFAVFYYGIHESSEPNVLVTFLDKNQNSVYSECWWFGHNLYDYRLNKTFKIYEDSITLQELSMNLNNVDISRLDTVDLKILSHNECQR